MEGEAADDDVGREGRGVGAEGRAVRPGGLGREEEERRGGGVFEIGRKCCG